MMNAKPGQVLLTIAIVSVAVITATEVKKFAEKELSEPLAHAKSKLVAKLSHIIAPDKW